MWNNRHRMGIIMGAAACAGGGVEQGHGMGMAGDCRRLSTEVSHPRPHTLKRP